ncbi:Cytochrome bo(3) ubiquinol oxidase subunit 2 [Buchnera aphidicola (Eriosoma grossulariae)]|uniref:ubiquinol oxidase subunit II n=1 Tax=Buchnera aphidicola TaxID=9 RepID=UPI0034643E07
MDFIKKNHVFKKVMLIIITICLSGFSNGILNPQGDIAKKQYHLILLSLGMMSCVVIPVIIMTFYFVWKYRESNVNSIYLPNWNYSKKIEFFIWSLPVFIIFILSLVSWHSTHALEPSKSIISIHHPIKIEVVALDWKWLFIYPDYKIATINKIVFPVNTPIKFNITSYSVMNSFFIPSLGSQIYAMKGMQSKLNLISDHPGQYKGISANYSGEGFSGMKFSVIVADNYNIFYQWIKTVKNSTVKISTINDFKRLLVPDKNHKTEYFSYIMPNLFIKILKNIDLI